MHRLNFLIFFLITFIIIPEIAQARRSPEVAAYLACLNKNHAVYVSDPSYTGYNGGLSGKIVELRGNISGIIETESSHIFILDTNENHSGVEISFEGKALPKILRSGEPVRVLVKYLGNSNTPQMIAAISEYVAAPYDPKPKAAPTVQKPVAARSVRSDVVSARGDDYRLAAYTKAVLYFNHRLSTGQAATIANHILNYSDHYGVDPRLVMAVIAVESGFNPSATSRCGAMGLGQLMPRTARGLGVGNAYDAEQNVSGAIKLIRGHLEKYNGKSFWTQISLALASYNAGSGAVKKFGGVPPYRETQGYVRKVVSLYKIFTGYK